jgi:SAM-dependent methyltransferase
VALQGELWSAAAYDWAALHEPHGRPLWELVLDAPQVDAGTRLLDAGCGGGGAALLAAQRDACVSGLDAAPKLVAIAHRRLPSADFRTGDLQALPYDDATFDAVIACNALQYAENPLVALRELRRVCAPRARLVLASWSAAEHCGQWTINAALRDFVPAPPGDPSFALAAPGVLEGLCVEAGLTIIGGGEVACPSVHPTLEHAWRAQVSAGPLQAALRFAGAQRLKAAVLEALAPYQTSDGTVRLHNRCRYITLSR